MPGSARIQFRGGMRIVYMLSVALSLALGAGAAAHAQLPAPFEPEPEPGKLPQCTKDYIQSVRRALEATEKLRAGGPEAVGKVCTMIEMGSAWFGGKLPDALRQELRALFGVDIDLEHLTTQCRSGQEALDRELAASVTRLNAELARCSDTI